MNKSLKNKAIKLQELYIAFQEAEEKLDLFARAIVDELGTSDNPWDTEDYYRSANNALKEAVYRETLEQNDAKAD